MEYFGRARRLCDRQGVAAYPLVESVFRVYTRIRRCVGLGPTAVLVGCCVCVGRGGGGGVVGRREIMDISSISLSLT